MTRTLLRFTVPGKPVPQGGMTAFAKGNRAFVTHKNPKGLGDYRARIALAAREAGAQVLEGPVRLKAAFVFPRPKSHYRTGRFAHLLKATAPDYVITTPDVDKTLRALMDGLTHVCFRDDAQVVECEVTKRYVDQILDPCTIVTVLELP